MSMWDREARRMFKSEEAERQIEAAYRTWAEWCGGVSRCVVESEGGGGTSTGGCTDGRRRRRCFQGHAATPGTSFSPLPRLGLGPFLVCQEGSRPESMRCIYPEGPEAIGLPSLNGARRGCSCLVRNALLVCYLWSGRLELCEFFVASFA